MSSGEPDMCIQLLSCGSCCQLPRHRLNAGRDWAQASQWQQCLVPDMSDLSRGNFSNKALMARHLLFVALYVVARVSAADASFVSTSAADAIVLAPARVCRNLLQPVDAVIEKMEAVTVRTRFLEVVNAAKLRYVPALHCFPSFLCVFFLCQQSHHCSHGQCILHAPCAAWQ